MVNETNINMLWASLLVEELIRNGVDLFVVSPGARSTPLALAVAGNPRARAVVHFDERGAAFFAQGYAKATQKPCGLVCTSGTAAANYLPGVVEAGMSCTPLIVLTADRPPELRETGANQTIRQPGLYGSYVRWEVDMPCPDRGVPPEFVLTTVDQAVGRARRNPAGPVHINCMFREPLTPVPDGENPGSYMSALSDWLGSEQPYTLYAQGQASPSERVVDRTLEIIAKAKRGIIIAGHLKSAEESAAVRRLAEALSWPVFPDIASGLRLGITHPNTIPYFEALVQAGVFKNAGKADAIIQLGHPFTSKRLLQEMAAAPPDDYALVMPDSLRYDPAHRVTLRVDSDIEAFCAAVGGRTGKREETAWLESLRASSSRVEDVLDLFFAQDNALTEPRIAGLISRHIPTGTGLFLANSMPIRDMDTFAVPGAAYVHVLVNRGASGIDGNIATAAGFGMALGAPVTAVVGDLAVLHDLNSLALLQQAKTPVVLVIINNNGGGIFSFLPVAENREHFDTFFRVAHGLGFKEAAAMFGIDYSRPRNPQDFVEEYEGALQRGKSAIIEVATDPTNNVAVHRQLNDAVCAALAML